MSGRGLYVFVRGGVAGSEALSWAIGVARQQVAAAATPTVRAPF